MKENRNKPRLVVLTGAGISAESGLKTFRDSGGLWEGYEVTDVASPEGWQRDPGLVLDFYNLRRREVIHSRPNAAHTGLGVLQDQFDLTVITQNIDDLHERGGCSSVIHLHGEILKMRSCLDSSTLYDITGDIHLGDLAPDGGQLRPHVVWFGEEVPLLGLAASKVRDADIFVLIGSSLQVYPAAGLIGSLPPGVPKFIIDRRIPPLGYMDNLHLIEEPATVGIRLLARMLVQTA